MNSVFSVLLKNALLLITIAVNVIFVFTSYIGYKEVVYVFSVLGILFVLASCYEAYALSRVNQGSPKFIYFTDGFLAKRFIKVIAFTCMGVLLFYSGSIIKYMAFICFLVAFTEITVTLWRYVKHLCFVAFEDHHLVISTNKLITIKANDIVKIEARHGLTYFVTIDNKTLSLRTDMMREEPAFKIALDSWINQHNLQQKVVVS